MSSLQGKTDRNDGVEHVVKTLRELIKDMPYFLESRGDLDTEVWDLTASSRDRTDKGLFFCFVGAHFDAHDYAPQAVENGSVALVVEHFLNLDVPQIRVSHGRRAMARMAAAFYDWPSRKLKLCGITGTKGKTTTSYMFKTICETAGYRCGLIGTTGTLIGNRMLASHLTTPDPVELQKTLHDMVEEHVDIVGMEVSAHAIDMNRLDGMIFECACYTNLSQDHLDYFGDMETYFQTKKSFLISDQVLNTVINADEDSSARVLEELKTPHVSYGISADADVFARDIEITEDGVSFDMLLRSMPFARVSLKMTGTFNVYNALAASAMAMVLGIEPEMIRRGLETIQSVPGRIETLQTETPYKVILDYSHSPDALKNILQTVREFSKGRVIALFGCGGDRDHGKRPKMGRIGGELADYCILTSDNPRGEDPMAILDAIEAGIRPTGKPYQVIEDRREAIRAALKMAREGDIIVLAGKGHETYQEIKGVRRPFNEKMVVRELLDEMREGR